MPMETRLILLNIAGQVYKLQHLQALNEMSLMDLESLAKILGAGISLSKSIAVD